MSKKFKEALAKRADMKPQAVRTAITPTDIYGVDKPKVEQKREVKTTQASSTKKRPKSALRAPRRDDGAQNDPIRHFSTYIRTSQFKALKVLAIEKGVRDQDIVIDALEAYLKNS